MNMFCYQCEQTAQGSGCTKQGVCGKDPDVAALQDLLVHVAKGIAQYAHRSAGLGKRDADVDRGVIEALFTTVTNVNFDARRMAAKIGEEVVLRRRARETYQRALADAGRQAEPLGGPAVYESGDDLAGMISQGHKLRLSQRIENQGRDVAGLQELALYGMKGAAAYVDHAQILGVEDAAIYADFHRLLDDLAGDPTDAGRLTALALEVGELNLRAMEILDRANTGAYGHPEPTRVRVSPVKGKCILVSGHDLKDLDELLEQTAGKGINVYTHGEMLPCLAYPRLKRHPHLVGNYGGAWQDQRREFAAFPGAILMTTNCIQRPKEDYQGRIFTSGLVAWPGVTHIDNRDFTPVIEAALAAEGFSEDAPEKMITIGFGHQAVLGVADQVISAVKSKAIRHFFLIGGCDGAKSGRNYYTELAEQVPDDCVILTLACGKFRFNKLEFGEIQGIPRLLDVGQCNDAHSAIEIVKALAGAFDCGVNDLPLSLVLSWYEQKAVGILLSLLHLGIRGIRIGPSLPAFTPPEVLEVLVANFDLKPITTPQEDLAAMLAGQPAG